jgi:hypothetical protein
MKYRRFYCTSTCTLGSSERKAKLIPAGKVTVSKLRSFPLLSLATSGINTEVV